MFGLDLLSVGVGVVIGLVASWLWTTYGPSKPAAPK